MDQVKSDKIQDRVPAMFRGVNAEDLVEPETRRREVPKTNANVDRDNRHENGRSRYTCRCHRLLLFRIAWDRFSANAVIAQLDFLEGIGLATIGETAVKRS